MLEEIFATLPEFSHLDSACFQRFVTLFAQQYPQEFHIWHLDRASAHIAKRLRLPDNLLLLFHSGLQLNGLK